MTFWKEGGAGASAATTCDRARREEGVIESVFVATQRRRQAAGVPGQEGSGVGWSGWGGGVGWEAGKAPESETTGNHIHANV